MPSNVVDTPDGFVVAAPWSSIDRALYIDVKCFLSSIRSVRNVLSARLVAKSINNVVLDQSFSLLQAAEGSDFSTFEYQAKAGNVAMVISSNRPVHVILTRASGTLDLGQITMFAISSPIVSVNFVNDENQGDAEINLIVV